MKEKLIHYKRGISQNCDMKQGRPEKVLFKRVKWKKIAKINEGQISVATLQTAEAILGVCQNIWILQLISH